MCVCVYTYIYKTINTYTSCVMKNIRFVRRNEKKSGQWQHVRRDRLVIQDKDRSLQVCRKEKDTERELEVGKERRK